VWGEIELRLVGFALTMPFAAVFLVKLTPPDKMTVNLVTVAGILVTCGAIFVLPMY